MAIKSIQATGGDFTTVALWGAYLEGIGTLTEDEIGQINAEELSSTVGTTLPGTIIIPGVFRVILEAQPNDSFRDGPDQLTTALRYGAQSRARWTHNSSDPMITTDIPDFTIRNLMLHKVGYGRMLHYTDAAATDNIIESCFLDSNTTGAHCIDARSLAIRNTVILENGDDSANAAVLAASGTVDIVNCVIGRTVATGSNRIGIQNTYADAARVVNTAVVNLPTDATGTIAGSHNATSLATGGLPATNRQNSLVGSTEFESVTDGSEDFRLKSTSVKCKDLGTASGTPTPPSTDIVGQSRSGSTDIGVWEFQAGGGAGGTFVGIVGGGFWYGNRAA